MTKLLAYGSISIFAAALLGTGCGGDDDSSDADAGEGGMLLTGGTINTGGVSLPETGGSGGTEGGAGGSSSGGSAGEATGGQATGGEGTGGEGTAGEGTGGEGTAGEGTGGEGTAGEGTGGVATGGAPTAGAAGEGPGGAGEGGSAEGGAGAAPPGGAGGAGGVPAAEAGAGGQGPEGTTLVITDLEDASITDGDPDLNLGDAETLVVDGEDGDHNDGSTGVLIRPAADALDELPAGATIVSAELVLYQIDPGDDIEVYLVTEDWSQDDVTFTDAPSTGALLTTVSGDNTDAELSIDIADEVIDWVDSGDAFGLLLAPTGAEGNDFNSTEASGPRNERPRLVIVYTE